MAYPVKSLEVLRKQIDERWPNRDKSNDGWIGDVKHAARASQHNPDADGSVDAHDFTHDPAHGFDAHAFADFMQTQRDRRIRNIISNRRILAGDKGPSPWTWRHYTGSNPHTAHIHVDVLDKYQDDETLWSMPGVDQPAQQEQSTTRYPEIKFGSRGDYVKAVQIMLMADGIFGRSTERAVKAFQRSKGLTVDGIVGPETWAQLEKLNEPQTVTAPAVEWQTAIVATEFGGSGDRQPVAYPDVPVDWNNRPGVALPYKFSGTRPRVEVTSKTKSVVCEVFDVGPWYPSFRGPEDPYWKTKTRPRAESDGRTNKAGIDLTPAAARAIGLNGKGIVNWRFTEGIK